MSGGSNTVIGAMPNEGPGTTFSTPSFTQPKLGLPDTNYALGGSEYNTIKQDPTTYGYDPSATGFQNNVPLMEYLRFGSQPTDNQMYGERVTFGSTGGTQPSGPGTGVINPNDPGTGVFGNRFTDTGYASYGSGSMSSYNVSNILSGFGYSVDPSMYGGSPWYALNQNTGSNLFNGQPGYGYPDAPGGYYVDPYGTGAKKNKTADKVMADLYDAQWRDYMNRFAPIEDGYANLLRRDTYEQEIANRDRLRSAVSIGGAFDRSDAMEGRRMERYGLEYRPDGDLQMAKVGSIVGGLNQATQMADDRRLAATSGGLQGIVSGTMNREFNLGGSDEEDK